MSWVSHIHTLVELCRAYNKHVCAGPLGQLCLNVSIEFFNCFWWKFGLNFEMTWFIGLEFSNQNRVFTFVRNLFLNWNKTCIFNSCEFTLDQDCESIILNWKHCFYHFYAWLQRKLKWRSKKSSLSQEVSRF